MVQALRAAETQRQQATAAVRPVVPPAPGISTLGEAQSGATAIYGPEGPTERSVRLLLEYRLMVTGNPRLRIGKIADDGTSVTAQVVTAEGSLVEEYGIDKKTGVWRPIR